MMSRYRNSVGDIAELYGPVAEDAGMELRLEAPAGLHVRANKTLLAQALSNLVENAIAHGNTGSGGVVTISARRSGDSCELRVADTGPGIPETERARVLERFVRLEASRSRPGSGLGLSLVNAVARLHNGELELKDNSPGLCAVLRLPIERGKGRNEDAGRHEGRRG